MANNYSRFAITSNEKWVIPATGDERRYFVLEIQNSKQNNHDYFGAIADQLDDGGYEAMMFDLMANEPKSEQGWNLLRNPPKSRWLKQQVDHSKNSVERFVDELIELGSIDTVEDCPSQPFIWDNADACTFNASDLQKHYVEWCKQQGIRYTVGNGCRSLMFDELNKHVKLKKVSDTSRLGKRGVYWDIVGDWVVDLED